MGTHLDTTHGTNQLHLIRLAHSTEAQCGHFFRILFLAFLKGLRSVMFVWLATHHSQHISYPFAYNLNVIKATTTAKCACVNVECPRRYKSLRMVATKLQFLIVADFINNIDTLLHFKMLSCKLIVVLMCVSCCVSRGLYG